MYSQYKFSSSNNNTHTNELSKIKIAGVKMKEFSNFNLNFLENDQILKMERGTAIVNEFKELPKGLPNINEPDVKWYQYRLHTKLYINNDDESGVLGIQEHAIKLSIDATFDTPIFKLYSYNNNDDCWEEANNGSLKVDNNNELRIISNNSLAAKDPSYKPVALNVSEASSKNNNGKKSKM